MQTATCGMNGSNSIVSGKLLCFAPLDDRTLDAFNTIEILAIPDDRCDDSIEVALNDLGIQGQAINTAGLAEVPDDRGEFVEVVCRVRRPVEAK